MGPPPGDSPVDGQEQATHPKTEGYRTGEVEPDTGSPGRFRNDEQGAYQGDENRCALNNEEGPPPDPLDEWTTGHYTESRREGYHGSPGAKGAGPFLSREGGQDHGHSGRPCCCLSGLGNGPQHDQRGGIPGQGGGEGQQRAQGEADQIGAPVAVEVADLAHDRCHDGESQQGGSQDPRDGVVSCT